MGFINITGTMLTIRMDFVNFDDYWIPLLTGQGTIAKFLISLLASRRQQIETAVGASYLCGLASNASPRSAEIQTARANVYARCVESETSLIGKAIFAVYQRDALARSIS